MQIITNIKQMQRLTHQLRKQNKTIGFVPTMGALHDGHLSLIKRAVEENDFVVLSIFVNPAQFGPAEDLSKYPRNFERDKKLARQEKVDCVFYPSSKIMYPNDFKTFVYVEDLSNRLCGVFRPGHFRGVTTVLTKLFNIVCPDTAYFGQKDIQQAVIVRKMARDLNFSVEIKVLPIIRDKNGLALSSRNKYLSPLQKKEAEILYKSLRKAEKLIKSGESRIDKVKEEIFSMINSGKTARLEYIEIINTKTLRPLVRSKGNILIAIACKFGQARLIDNIIIKN